MDAFSYHRNALAVIINIHRKFRSAGAGCYCCLFILPTLSSSGAKYILQINSFRRNEMLVKNKI